VHRRASQTRAREACAHFYRVSTNSNTRQQRRRDVICAKARARPERLVKPASAPLAYAPLVGAVRLGHARRGARQPLVPKPLVPKPLVPKTLVQKGPLCPRLLVPLTLHPKSGAEAVGLARFSDHCLNGSEQLQNDLIPSSACASDCGTVIPILRDDEPSALAREQAVSYWGQGSSARVAHARRPLSMSVSSLCFPCTATDLRFSSAHPWAIDLTCTRLARRSSHHEFAR